MHSFDISSMIIFDILFSCAETEKLASFHETLNAEEPTQIPLLFFFYQSLMIQNLKVELLSRVYDNYLFFEFCLLKTWSVCRFCLRIKPYFRKKKLNKKNQQIVAIYKS